MTLASVYNLPASDSRLIGEQTIHKAIKGDYFQALAENYNVGFFAWLAANPNVDPFSLEPGSNIVIPKQMLLPYVSVKALLLILQNCVYIITQKGKS